jgi:hypothetical protein
MLLIECELGAAARGGTHELGRPAGGRRQTRAAGGSIEERGTALQDLRIVAGSSQMSAHCRTEGKQV